MDGSTPTHSPSRRARIVEEAVLEVNGVAGVRVWELPSRIEVGILVAPFYAAMDVLQRVNEVIEGLRSPDEEWDVGVLND
jgi:hypothetical protein